MVGEMFNTVWSGLGIENLPKVNINNQSRKYVRRSGGMKYGVSEAVCFFAKIVYGD